MKKKRRKEAGPRLLKRFFALPFPFFRWQRVNLPNLLTLLRMAGLPFFLALFLSDDLAAQWASLGLFAVLAFTDWLDGYIARSTNQVTNFGKVMDPLADKLMMLTVMICLTERHVVPAWMVIIILWRELAVTGLRALVAGKRTVLAADSWGKAKTVLQVAAVISGMFLYVLHNALADAAPDWRMAVSLRSEWAQQMISLFDANALPFLLMFFATILSLWSGIRYFRKNWEVVCLELENADHGKL